MDFRLSLTYVIGLAAASAVTFLYRLVVQRRRFNDLPCPPHSFIWGHIKLWEETVAAAPPGISPQALYTIISQKYNMPGVWYLDLWPVNGMQLIADDPDSMDFVQVLEGYDHHHNIDRLARVAIGSQLIATVNGPIWHALHNRIAPAFTQSHIRTQYSVIAEETSVFRDQLVKLSQTGESFSMMEKTQHLIFDIVGRLIFNFSTNAQTHGSPYLEDLCESINLFVKWSGQSYWKNPLAKRQTGRQRTDAQDRLSALITSKIHERLEVLKATKAELDPKTPLSVVDLLLREQLMENKSEKMGQLTAIAPDEMERLVTNVKGLLLGGQGTTADSLTYIFMLLANHPEVVSRLREEHDRVFGRTVSETEQKLANSPNKVNDLLYTNAVVKEALRLFPIGYSTKQSPPGAMFKYQGRDYPSEGFAIVPNHQTLHFNPRYFPKPSEFRPERFLNDAIPHSYFRAFGRGQRSCIGQPLAIDILIVILLLTIREFDFTSYGLKPNAVPKTIYTDMDTVYGDIIFQTNDPLGAKPNGPMMMTVQKIDRVYA